MKTKLLIVLIVLAACSGEGNGEIAFQGENLALTISNSRSFNPDISYGQIDHYQLTVTAPDLKTPFTSRFGGDAATGKMAGIPSGTSRTITIEAFNPDGLVIRRGKKEGVSVIPGAYSHVEIVMHSVPIFTNVRDKGAVAGTRFGFKVFGEPGSRLEILKDTGDTEEALPDLVTGRTLLNTTNADGVFSQLPQELERGPCTFKVEDMDSGESSSVRLTVYDATTRPGFLVNSGGRVRRLGNDLVMSGVGQSYYRDVVKGADHLGNETMLDVVDVIY